MSDLAGHVADALFQAELGPEEPISDRFLAMSDARLLAVVALQAARAQGWRIVKTAPKLPAGRESEYVIEEWTGG